MFLQCLGAWVPFLLITFGPMLAIKIFVRPTLPRRMMLWAWRTWLVGLIFTVTLMVGGALLGEANYSSLPADQLYYGSAGASPARQAAVARISADGSAPAAYLQLVYSVAGELQPPFEPELFMGLIRQESAWYAGAESPSGAMGLAQLMPDTAAEMGVTNPWDPEQSIRGGMKYLAFLHNYFNGDLDTAIMAYHAGPGNMSRRGPSSLDQYYLSQVKSYYADYRAKASVGLMRPFGAGSQSCEIGPLYEYAVLTQSLHGRDYGHNAIDLSGGPGSPLYSPIDGEITGRYVDGLRNTVLEIENDCWIITLMHGDYKAELGDKVRQGELIGWEDNHGNTWYGGRPCHERDGCGDHAHLNMFNKETGRNEDPLQYQVAVELVR